MTSKGSTTKGPFYKRAGSITWKRNGYKTTNKEDVDADNEAIRGNESNRQKSATISFSESTTSEWSRYVGLRRHSI